jgi:hypothetical protein
MVLLRRRSEEEPRRLLWGHPRDFLISIVVCVGLPLLALWTSSRYPLVDANDPIIFQVPAVGWILAFAAIIPFSGKIMPWSLGVPGLRYIASLVMGLFGAFIAAIAFDLGNALLDGGRPTEKECVVEEQVGPLAYIVTPIDGRAMHLTVDRSRAKQPLPPGTRVVLIIRPGFFGKPWLDQYRVRP